MPAELTVLEQYIEFCGSPLHSTDDIVAEYNELQRNPNIQYVGFHKPHILMVGTSELVITWDGISYEIGEFVIFFIRKRVGRIWEIDFRLINVTNSIDVYDEHSKLRSIIMHPHAIDKKHEDIQVPTAPLCISSGQFVIYQSLRKGYINKAFSHLWKALQTYDTGTPYHDVEDWPLLLKEISDD